MKKIFKPILVFMTIFAVSFYYFPISLQILPSVNTKMILAAMGIVAAALTMIRHPNNIPRNLVPIMLLGASVSLISLFSIVFNGTGDTSYVSYFVSMMVWLGGAFMVCVIVRYVHDYLDVRIVGKYLIAVCVMQSITALMIDNIPAFERFSNSIFNLGKPMMDEMNRMYGWGAGLDVAGIRFSLCLILIAALITDDKFENSRKSIYLYILCYLFIAVVGCMIARTTYVGIGLSMLYMAVSALKDRFEGYGKVFGPFLVILTVGIIACVFMYKTNPYFRHGIRFAFEGFFNLFERGEYSVASTETLKSMYVFPDNIKTWIIGDGYFVNPYWFDPNFIWHGENIKGYYKGTDVGYLRFIFYSGLIGLSLFSIYMIKCAKTCAGLLSNYKMLFGFVCLAGFVIWLKVATDVFLFFALFICVGNMYVPSPQEMELDAGQSD